MPKVDLNILCKTWQMNELSFKIGKYLKQYYKYELGYYKIFMILKKIDNPEKYDFKLKMRNIWYKIIYSLSANDHKIKDNRIKKLLTEERSINLNN